MSSNIKNRPFYSFRIAKYDPHNCDVCNISCNSKIIYDNHIKGKKHQKAYEKLKSAEFYCEICDNECKIYDVWKEHQNSKEHLAQLQKNSLNQIREHKSTLVSSDPLMCKICERKFDSNVILQSHLTGQRHKRNLREIQITRWKDERDPRVYCEECDITLDPDNMKFHREGVKHKKVVAKYSSEGIIVNRSLERCPICEIEFVNIKDAKSHYLTNEHLERVKNKDDSIFWCDVCKVQVQSRNILNAHLNGFKHFFISNRNNMNPEGPFREKFLRKLEKSQRIRQHMKEKCDKIENNYSDIYDEIEIGSSSCGTESFYSIANEKEYPLSDNTIESFYSDLHIESDSSYSDDDY